MEYVKGSLIAGISFPTPGIFQLRLLRAENTDNRKVENFDLLFLGIEGVDIKSRGALAASQIIEVASIQERGAHWKFVLANGSISVQSREVLVRVFNTE